MLNKIGLRWCISIIITLFIMIILSIVSYTTYNYTIHMVQGEISDKIRITKEAQKNSLNMTLNNLKTEVENFTLNDKVKTHAMFFAYTDEENLAEELSSNTAYRVEPVSQELQAHVNASSADYTYITSTWGTVLADSGYVKDKDFDKYIGVKLTEKEYKVATAADVFQYNNNYIQQQAPVYNGRDEIIAYYVMGVDLAYYGKM
ncbi:hypothetical protein GM661_17090 [Iocasia frigidifontis]|uniref:Methyl-accepting chemotaxis protein n=1 Tax=Iocasia fonsfrigidae TaxID=2682810 RepID=A0A8A7KDP6_9FIRM|nr:hypothetical protein [Iocasia fonsfrigidae]QTL99541.1 hypothetical protein GM661_17090 [Iocasia fonsfrigidae]